ncbi:glycosyltransferase family 2 protein [Riemerella anatipestifer]|nr:glycosyltransferase family 2 protein [Riemerella anatipestifer]
MVFSILIAHYNNYQYFTDCYNSILNQTYQNFEVIIVDDGSNDGSIEKIEELLKHDDRFKIFKNEKNEGIGYTKRKCVELAVGDICGFLDPDDALTTDALQVSLEAYQRERGIIATYSKHYVCNEFLEVDKIYDKTIKISNNNSHFFNIHFEVNHFFTFRRDKYQETVGVEVDVSSAVDQDLYMKLYELGNFLFINKPLYFYRIHQKGISHNKDKKEVLKKNWHFVLSETLKRRNIKVLYGTPVEQIDCLPRFLFEKENSFLKRITRKINRRIL